MSPTRRDGLRTRRPRVEPAVAVISPFADEEDVRVSPTWLERLRGLAGMTALVLVSGIVLAVLVAATLLLLAVFVATTFS
jgi:hypothetical protein